MSNPEQDRLFEVILDVSRELAETGNAVSRDVVVNTLHALADHLEGNGEPVTLGVLNDRIVWPEPTYQESTEQRRPKWGIGAVRPGS